MCANFKWFNKTRVFLFCRHKRALRNPRLTAAILEELLGNLDEIDAV